MVASKNNPKKNPSAKKKIKPGLLFIFIAIIPAIFYFLFFMNTEKSPEQLKGSWLRSDGPYTAGWPPARPRGLRSACR